MFRVPLCIVVLTVGLFFIHTPSAFAQGAGIKLIPATFERAADPGTELKESFTITNVSDEEKLFYIYTRNIKGVSDGNTPVFAENEEVTGFEVTEWLNIPTESITIPARGEYVFPLTIAVPQGATPGSHFGAILVSVEPPRLREIGASVGYEVASIISIRISGDVIDDARIRSFFTDKLFYGSKKVDFTARIENQGNILIRPRGPLTIQSMFGSESSLSVNENQSGVFPGSVHDLTFTWKEEGIGFGRYEAILALAFDGNGGQRTIDASVVFWIFPTKIMLPVIVAFLVIGIGGYLLTRYYINQAIMRAAGGRRIPSARYRRQVGISRFAFVFVSLMAVCVLFLLVLLIFFA